MISANVIRGVEELLDRQGLRRQNEERLGDLVARKLDISAQQAEVLLESLHDGADLEEALRRAKIPARFDAHNHFLNDLARTIGSALGRVAR